VRVWTDGDLLRITDTNAPLQAIGLCRQVGAHEAACPKTGLISIAGADGDDAITSVFDGIPALSADVHGGDGDDRLSGTGQLHGDAGADLITLAVSVVRDDGSRYGAWGHGGLGDDTVLGSDGDDMLSGEGGRDTLSAGPGDDVVNEGDSRGAGDRDVLDGGPGKDSLDYTGHDENLLADLRADRDQIRDRESGPLDAVSGFESLRTGSGDDIVIGTGGDDGLGAGAGDDVIRLGPGQDSVTAGPGDDRVLAAGDDMLMDSIVCGPGDDDVVAETGDDLHGCERTELRIARRPVTRIQRRGPRLRPLLDCSGVVPDCYGFTQLYWRDRHEWRGIAGRRRIVCVPATVPCGARARGDWVRLGNRARQALERDRRLELQAITAFEVRGDPRGARRLAVQFYKLRRRGTVVGDPSPTPRPELLGREPRVRSAMPVSTGTACGADPIEAGMQGLCSFKSITSGTWAARATT
jgi:hypothetical protein